jgi:hypothetical protein
MTERSAIRAADLLPEHLSVGTAVDQEMQENPNACPPGLAWDLVSEQAASALRSLLDCDVLDLLAQAWAKAQAIRAYADPAQHPPGELAIVHLAEHSFVREIHPVLKIQVAGCAPISLRFTVVLKAEVRGLALSIESGHILAMSAGDAAVSAQLKYGEFNLTNEKQSRKLPLPGRHVFTPGIAIPPPASVNAAEGA